MTKNIGVLISGTGTNLQSIIDKKSKGVLSANIAVVISNNENAYGLIIAKNKNIPTHVVPHKDFTTREEHEKKIIDILKGYNVDLVVLAGYMRILTKFFISHYPEKIINIHPALLPSFRGVDAQRQAVEYGVKISGATVHFVDEKVDHGPIIIQGAVPVSPQDKRDDLAQRILNIEHRILPQAIQWICEGRIKIQGTKVILINKNKPKADIKDIMPCLINPQLEEGF